MFPKLGDDIAALRNGYLLVYATSFVLGPRAFQALLSVEGTQTSQSKLATHGPLRFGSIQILQILLLLIPHLSVSPLRAFCQMR